MTYHNFVWWSICVLLWKQFLIDLLNNVESYVYVILYTHKQKDPNQILVWRFHTHRQPVLVVRKQVLRRSPYTERRGWYQHNTLFFIRCRITSTACSSRTRRRRRIPRPIVSRRSSCRLWRFRTEVVILHVGRIIPIADVVRVVDLNQNAARLRCDLHKSCLQIAILSLLLGNIGFRPAEMNVIPERHDFFVFPGRFGVKMRKRFLDSRRNITWSSVAQDDVEYG